MKPCIRCGELKSTTEYHKDASKRDGLRPYCKACIKITAAAYGVANREKKSAYSAAWIAANPERHKATQAAWYAANGERHSACKAAWREKNRAELKAKRLEDYWSDPEKQREKNAKWYADNRDAIRARRAAAVKPTPESRRIHWQNRRARKLENGGKLSRGLSDRLFKLQRGKCACGCKQPLGADYHLDHIMPLSLGGANTDDNMQLLTATCNMKKGSKHPVKFMQQRGFLL